jgi:uncharacterized protein (TIGR02996 family)
MDGVIGENDSLSGYLNAYQSSITLMVMDTLDGLLNGIVADPQDEGRWLVLADYLEEYDDPRRAELLRLHRRLLATCCEPDEHPERAIWQAQMVELLGQGVKPCVPQRAHVLVDGLEMKFSFVPSGSSLMGSPKEEEGRESHEERHRVTLTRGFWLGVCPVTQAQWRAVTGESPSHFQADTLPVEHVTWDDCVACCKRLGPAFRLPSEAQWEYACRAGTTTPYFSGATISTDQANCSLRFFAERRPMPVGGFPPNAWALHDMHGNIWQWCQDAYKSHPKEDQVDPVGGEDSRFRVLRGGYWAGHPERLRSAFRLWGSIDSRYSSFGCRVLMGQD